MNSKRALYVLFFLLCIFDKYYEFIFCSASSLPYALDDVISKEFWEGVEPYQIVSLASNATAKTQANPSVKYQHLLCCVITANDTTPLPIKRKNIEESLGIYLHAVVVDKYKQRACFDGIVSVNDLNKIDVSGLGISWQALPHLMKISAKLIRAMDGEIPLTGHHLTINYLNTSKYGDSAIDSLKVMDYHFNNLLNSLKLPFSPNLEDHDCGAWGSVRKRNTTTPCPGIPSFTKDNVGIGKNSFHITFDLFVPLPKSCLTNFIDILIDIEEVGKVGIGTKTK